MGDAEQTVIRILGNIGQIPAADWDACHDGANPFISHAFLSALEASGCAVAETGWAPCHLIVERGGAVLGAVPMYLKSNSFGEYVFDHSWAAAFERAGGRYYPKLQVAVPFTPVTGPRLLARDGAGRAEVEATMIAGCLSAAEKFEASSVHFTFPTGEEWSRLSEMGLLGRTDQQFHWLNQGYQTFDDFLGELSSRKRKTIRRERREAVAHGVTIETIAGADIGEAEWDAFYSFYLDTGSRKWGQPYLNREFFGRLGETMPDNVALVMCSRDGRYIAGALNIIGRDALYGRYWGCCEDHRFLHFEACYYQAIDFAIARGLDRVEAGAQGPHKLARGYLPCKTYSAHWIADPGLRRAIDHFLDQEREMVDADIESMDGYSPYRRD